MQAITHPYTTLTGGEWIRGNLHTHTTASDGLRPLQEVVSDYARRGYGFLMISDHDLYTEAAAFETIAAEGLTLIPGNEISAHGPHLLHVNADRLVAPDPLRQQAITAIAAGKGFCIINHPNWFAGFNHCPFSKMAEWVGFSGVEIYNGVIGRLDGSPYATDKWDMLLTQGRRIWGFANDDSHRPTDVELGWNVAYVQDRSVESVVNALRTGRFYASTGVNIDLIAVEDRTIRLRAPNAGRIVALMQTGRRFAQADAAEIEVTVPEGATYVRFECWGNGEASAWTQPFFVAPQ